MTYAYLRFFNIQYWYCVISSWFGGKCTDTQFTVTSGTASTTDVSIGEGGQHVGFWDWLFGVHSASGTSGGLLHQGLFGAIESAVGFLGTVFGGIFGWLWSILSAVSFLGSFLLFLGIIGTLIGIVYLQKREEMRVGNLPPQPEGTHPLRERWQTLIENAMSADPREWKEGILGADVLLGELFEKIGYAGRDTAERIKSIPDGAFANLSSAWEAHRIKNLISLPTSHYILTQREAFRVMKLYEQVFKEFDFI